jgi:parallel beta-helix repeat protein
VRGYSDGVYARGQDSAGFLVFEQCSGNTFRHNSATHSGDGFFLYAGSETLKKTGKGGCNDNLVEGNDFSYAVANGIEATFSGGNRFVGNVMRGCDHGVWAGYSYDTRIDHNTIEECSNGISIEHGRENRITSNRLLECARGIHLWSSPNKDLDESPFGRSRDVRSGANQVAGNSIEGGSIGVRLSDDVGSSLASNGIARAKVAAMELAGSTAQFELAGNRVDVGPEAIAVRNRTSTALSLDGNFWSPWPPRIEGPLRPVTGAVGASFWGANLGASPGSVRTVGRDVPAGRQFIMVDEWGPIDPSTATLFPLRQSAVGAAKVIVIGAWDRDGTWAGGMPFRVVAITEGFDVEPREGRVGALERAGLASLKVRAKAGGATIAPFELRVKVADREEVARGTIFSTRWTTRFWKWEKDPRTDRAAFDALVKTPPLVTRETDALEIATGGAPADGVPADRFATVAETSLDLPAGKWRLRVTSDDGVRVLVDGKPVFTDWTWHGPKEDAVDLDLAAGRHVVRVEHFELDGWAALRCSLEPVIDRR